MLDVEVFDAELGAETFFSSEDLRASVTAAGS